MIWRDEREIVQVLLKEKSSHVYCLNTNFSICASMDKDLYRVINPHTKVSFRISPFLVYSKWYTFTRGECKRFLCTSFNRRPFCFQPSDSVVNLF